MQKTNIKYVPIVYPQAILDNTSPTTYCVDISGARYVQVFVQLGATDIAMTALKLQESDTLSSSTALSSGADITGLDFTGSLPSATDDNKTYLFSFPNDGSRKKYIDLTATCGDGSTGTFLTAFAILYDNDVHNDNYTSFNVAAEKRIP